MSDLFLTNPGEFKKNRKAKPKGLIDLKEEVEAELINVGVPFDVARVSCIDYKQFIYEGHHDKKSAYIIAQNMLPTIKKAYKLD